MHIYVVKITIEIGLSVTQEDCNLSNLKRFFVRLKMMFYYFVFQSLIIVQILIKNLKSTINN